MPACDAADSGGRCFLHGSTQRVCIPAGTHIVFIGDSVSRFQYLTLAYALLHGREAVEGRGAHRLHVLPSWTNYTAFFRGTSSIVNDTCDCSRAKGKDMTWRNSYENRYFRSGGVRLTFLQQFGRHPMKGDWWPTNASSPIPRIHDPLTEDFAPSWKFSQSEGIQRLLPAIGSQLGEITHVVFSMGGFHLDIQQDYEHVQKAITDVELREWRAAFAAIGLADRVWFKTYTAMTKTKSKVGGIRYADYGRIFNVTSHVESFTYLMHTTLPSSCQVVI